MTNRREAALRVTMLEWSHRRHQRGEIVANTLRSHLHHIRSFSAAVGADRAVGDITVDDIERWLETLTVAPSSRNTMMATVRAFYRWANQRGLTDRDPTLDIKRAKVPRRRPRAAAPDLAAAIVNDPRVPFRARVMITVLAHTGIRRAELAGLQVQDWDRANRTLLIRGKGDKEREVAVDGEATEALAAWLIDGRRSGPMWPSVRGGGLHPNRVAQIVTEASEILGERVTPHQWRHTMATEMARDGAPMTVVRDRLGHASLATTDTYTATRVDDQRRWSESRRYRHDAWEVRAS